MQPMRFKIFISSVQREFAEEREIRGFNLSAKASPLELLTALELVDDAGRIVNSAALLFGKRPQRFFRNSEVKCAWFLTPEVAKPIEDYQLYKGDVFQLADQATAFVMSHLSRRIGEHDGETGTAPTKYELPRKAVFEAIVNAICHRDCTSPASVQVMPFPDRLEILSPGPLPKGMTVAKLHKRHRSLPTNPLLAQAMFFRGYIEKVGSGTRDMIDRCREWGIEPPRWEDDEGDFVVVIRRPTALETTLHTTEKTTLHPTEKATEKTSVRMSIARAIADDPFVTMDELAEMFGLTQDDVYDHVKALRREMNLRRMGGRKSGHWAIGSQKTGRASK